MLISPVFSLCCAVITVLSRFDTNLLLHWAGGMGLGLGLLLGIASLALGRSPLHRARHHLRNLERMGLGGLWLSPKGKVLACNETATILLGQSEEALCQQNLAELMQSGNGKGWVNEWEQPLAPETNPVRRAIAQNQAQQNQIIGIPQSGGYGWRSLDLLPERNRQGEVQGWRVAVRDWSDRHATEVTWRMQAKGFQQLTQSQNLACWVRQVEPSKMEYLSPAFETIWQRSIAEICQSSEDVFLETVHPLDRDRIQTMIAGKLVGMGVTEYRILRPSGEVRWIRDRGFPIYAADGSIERLMGIAEDITDWREDEASLFQIAQREQSLIRIMQQMRQTLNLDEIFRATTSELRLALGCDRVAIYHFHPDWSGVFVAESVGKGWHSLIDQFSAEPQEANETLGSDRCVVQSLENAKSLVEDTFLQETKGGGYSNGLRYIVVNDIYLPGFETCYLELLEKFQARAYLTVPIFSGERLWGLMASYQNDSPRQWQANEIKLATQIGAQLGIAIQQADLLRKTQKQAEALEAAKVEADAANQAKSKFLASMSHELRTPLNAILGFADLLMQDDNLFNEQRELLQIIDDSGQHLLELINSVLEMSRIEAGVTILEEKAFNLLSLLNDIEKLFRLQIETRGIQFILERDLQLPAVVCGDAGKLRQVLVNLLGNAMKFTQKGRIILRAEVDGTLNPNMAVRPLAFSVRDTGAGIPPEQLAQIFEPFGQTEMGRQAGGAGLGLPISQQFVRLMGGSIQVTSNIGVGSCFRFVIPARVAEVGDRTRLTAAHLPIILSPEQPRPRLMVVEDSAPNRLLLLKLLRSLGFSEVLAVENGQLAVDQWQHWQPDLIWMDMQMPVMDGYEATRQIREHSAGQSFPIIALTASAFEEQRAAIFAAGCNDLVVKPFRREELVAALQRHLSLRFLVTQIPPPLSHPEAVLASPLNSHSNPY